MASLLLPPRPTANNIAAATPPLPSTTNTSTTMPEYKLTYFNGRGMGELIRWIFLYGNIPFTQERVELSEWPERKKATLGGKLPTLEVDGELLLQSSAIGRYLATKTGLVPQCPWRAAQCDALVDTFKDVLFAIFDIVSPKDQTEEEKQAKLREEYLPQTLGPLMERLEQQLQNKEWFVEDKMTWADLAIGRAMEEVFLALPDLCQKFPRVNAQAEKIYQLPRIKEHRKTRPVTDF